MTVLPSIEPAGFADLVTEARMSVLPRLRRQFPTVADDAFGDALIKASEHWPNFDEVERPMAWVWTVARRMAARQARRESRRPLLESRAVVRADAEPDTSWLHEVVDALSHLRPEHAAALRLTQIDDLDIESTAAVLGVSPNTVKVWVHRARRQLVARTAGIGGRWVSEEIVSPSRLAQRLCANGDGHLVDDVLPIVAVDREVRWELHVAGGRYWLGTDDGARQDFGEVGLSRDVLSTRSIGAIEIVDGRRIPIPLGSSDGTSWHRFVVDGDRLHLHLVKSEIPDTAGIPDPVFRCLLLDSITYRWVGHLEPIRAGGHPGVARTSAGAMGSGAVESPRRRGPGG